MADYRLSAAARSDIRSIWNYTDDEWGSAQAEKHLDRMEQTILLLARNPALGRSRDEIRPGYRSHPCGRHIIFYRIVEEEIEIARILHQRMEVRGTGVVS